MSSWSSPSCTPVCLSVCQMGSFQPTTACLPLVQGTSCDVQSHQWANLSVERARVPGFGDWWKSVSYSGGFSQLGENKNKYGEYLFVLKEIKVDRRRRGGGEGG